MARPANWRLFGTIEMVEVMREAQSCNLVTFNTLIKGHNGTGDMSAAKDVFPELEQAAFSPVAMTFSCLLSGAA